MTRTTALLIAFVFCLAYVACSAVADEPNHLLELHFAEGQQLVLTTTTETATTRTWNDQDRESDETAGMTLGLKVLSVDDDGTATIEATIAAVVLKADMGRWSYEYDSDDPPDEIPRPAAPFAAVIGKTFTIELTPGGDVPTIEGMDTLTKAAMDTVPEDRRQRGWGRGQVTRHLSEDAFRMMIEAAFGFVPDEPVAVGDSWTRTIDVDRGIPVKSDETYTLTELKDGTATITLEAKLGPRDEEEADDGDDDEAEARPRATYDVSGTQKGTLTVDIHTGCTFKLTITQQLDGDMVMTGFRGDDTERTMPIESDATITIECKQPPEEAAGETAEEAPTDKAE